MSGLAFRELRIFSFDAERILRPTAVAIFIAAVSPLFEILPSLIRHVEARFQRFITRALQSNFFSVSIWSSVPLPPAREPVFSYAISPAKP